MLGQNVWDQIDYSSRQKLEVKDQTAYKASTPDFFVGIDSLSLCLSLAAHMAVVAIWPLTRTVSRYYHLRLGGPW